MREIGGRDHEDILGAGVDRILQIVLIEGMTHCGASLMFCSNCGDSWVNLARFTEVALDGVLLFESSFSALFPRGVFFDGVLEGVVFFGVDDCLVGVPGLDLFFDAVVPPIDLSRNV